MSEECCQNQESHRDQILKTLSIEGLIKVLEDQLESAQEDSLFLAKKIEVLNQSIAKLKS